MRFVPVPATLLVLSTLVCAVAQTKSDDAASPPQKQNPLSGSPEHRRQIDQYLNSTSGHAGTQEPMPADHANNSVFVNGTLNVPGAPTDGQTVPAKFSQRNKAIDKTPIMAMGLGLSADQRRKILDAVRATKVAPVVLDAKVTQELMSTVKLHALPQSVVSEIPNLKDVKFVPLADKVLLVYAPNRIVVSELKP
ncbi:MAG TPA: hypothetical protein VMH84_17480 [Xanthobacteraceae bacterium]|nr:hypothetical protein [Xanthobacteraceae bacterium]